MRLQLNERIISVSVVVLALAVTAVLTARLCPPPAEMMPTRNNELVKRAGHHISRRSFVELQCKGVYDKSIFARLDRICEDCYNLFREHQLHRLCRNDCFTSDYFLGCVEALQLTDELEQYKLWIKQLHGADPNL